ncbi:MAG: hypothetical protein EOS76_06845 [Mesorhizobium sp.]|uniref:ThiF family adenylyltransferase n=1 Tax=unclassified Mesorhizobium TaxID=325217 RepID=UPI000F74C88A|nr:MULTISPECIES: ThiF family adenylyltransferase [unclassified Mesorhizobium]RVC80998.1 hypothetical protein EN766_04190 [Mesorhizobium sp. M2A.F.Ca.ET.046.02.1.1]AZO34028.1 hypothetical protein EJ072_05540 [Mesorhizobium sp. M2A.F.Ca.ET.046.03.2.1]AZO71451.1 hypothetical protein EJ067_09890 [Mesorhizobium sp. M1D.F.Ca.ET.043.01.1.1]RWB47016.1 MAG: hypothetical protein EOQ44_07510 [Mesorhizobium sp.]RWE20803.1 MAG: hypothetical protein EOS76_06845 [Mesorhizobium sp.]
MADERDIRRRIHDAFSQREFKRDWGSGTYVGLLDPTDLKISATVEVTDLNFVRAPTIRLADQADIKRTIPHLLSSDLSLCYFEQGAVILDRYNPTGTVLQCLEQADKVLRDGMRGRLDADFADEFQVYWGLVPVMIDLPVGFTGDAKINVSEPDGRGEAQIVLTRGASWLTKAPDPGKGRYKPSEGLPCRVVRTKKRLTINPDGHWPPDTLADLNVWLRWVDPGLVGAIEIALRQSHGSVQYLAIAAANGVFIARIELPKGFRTPEFLKTRRAALPYLLERFASKIGVDRTSGYRADPQYVFGRNMSRIKNLSGKRILLIGCGTIGGFLAHQLAQAGAGAQGGKLTLVDRDTLKTENLGRHLLGAPYLGKNKAEGCAAFLYDQLPMLSVSAAAGDVFDRDLAFNRFDLLVDATGEEALSIAINDKIVRSRPHAPAALFVWLIGNGAAAQCLLVCGPDGACFKCLKPALNGEPRFRTLKKGVETEVERNLACGDARYVPFPVSRSVAAASLACEAAIDWVNGVREPTFRSATLDRHKAFMVKDALPAKAANCPACGQEA